MAEVLLKVGDTAYHKGSGKRVTIVREFSSHFQCEDGKSLINASKRVGVDLIPILSGGIAPDRKPESINVNVATKEELQEFIPGLGRMSAKKIVDRKPEGGYINLNNLRDLNVELTLNWEELAPKLEF